MRRVFLAVVLVAALLPLVAACQKAYDERAAVEEEAAPSCECEEKCPECVCEEEGKPPAPRGDGKGKGKGKGSGGGPCGEGKGRGPGGGV